MKSESGKSCSYYDISLFFNEMADISICDSRDGSLKEPAVSHTFIDSVHSFCCLYFINHCRFYFSVVPLTVISYF